MSLLTEKYQQRDLFILDISDVMPKDDLASMEHPMFSLTTRPDMRHLEYQNGDNSLKIVPSGFGLPTIFDKDILIFCVSQLMHMKNRAEKIGKRVKFSARELMLLTNRRTGGVEYKRLEKAFQRLVGTTFTTNIRTGSKRETRVFSLVDEGGFVMQEDGKWRLDYCEVVLSDWMMRAIEANEVASISPDYFFLRRPMERRLYEIARKHCGDQPKWHIGLTKLQMKTGSNAPIKRFRHNLRAIINDNHIPFYSFELDDKDLVTVIPKAKKIELAPDIIIPKWAVEKARDIAQQKGWDYYALEKEWTGFAKAKTADGDPPKNAGAAFVSFCLQKEKLR